MTRTTAEAYAEALAELRKAEAAMDQAHSMLKDLRLDHDLAARYRGTFLTPWAVCGIVKDLADNMDATICEYCGKRLGDSAECIQGRCTEAENEALSLRRCTGAVEVTVREERREPDGTLRVISEKTSVKPEQKS